MGDKFDTYEKQNMGQCAEKKIYTKCTGTRHHGVLSVQLRRILSDSCAKKEPSQVLVKIWRKTSLRNREHQQKMCTLDNLEVIISVVVKKTLYKSDLPALVVVCSRNLQIF